MYVGAGSGGTQVFLIQESVRLHPSVHALRPVDRVKREDASFPRRASDPVLPIATEMGEWGWVSVV